MPTAQAELPAATLAALAAPVDAREVETASSKPAAARLPSSADGEPAKPTLDYATPLAKPKSLRDNRLDFWRGLCLIDMLLVHLIHQGMSMGVSADVWVGEYTRFAAGGFVFIAGLSIGRIFLPRTADPVKRWQTYKALWRRALVILAVHYVAEIGFLVMWPVFGGVAFRRLHAPLWDILTFRAGYDLLPFYVVMVALAPGMLELMRRKLWWVLGAVSVGLFAAAHTWNLWDHFKLPIQHDFFPVLWQLIFVVGVLGAQALPAFDRLATSRKVAVAAGLWAAQFALFAACYGKDFGLQWWLPLTFAKVPLTFGEALRYLTLIAAIMATTDLLWRRWFDGGRVAQFSETLGRNSLAVYVFHVWIVQAAVHASALHPERTFRVLLAVAGVGAMWVFASLLEQGKPAKRKEKSAPDPKPVGEAGPADVAKSAGAAKAAEIAMTAAAVRATGPTDRLAAVRQWFRWGKLTRLPTGGLPGLAVATIAAVFVANLVQRQQLPRKWAGGRNATFHSPAAELLAPRPPESPPEFAPDPTDEEIDGDDEETPLETADAEAGAQVIAWPPGEATRGDVTAIGSPATRPTAGQ